MYPVTINCLLIFVSCKRHPTFEGLVQVPSLGARRRLSLGMSDVFNGTHLPKSLGSRLPRHIVSNHLIFAKEELTPRSLIICPRKASGQFGWFPCVFIADFKSQDLMKSPFETISMEGAFTCCGNMHRIRIRV